MGCRHDYVGITAGVAQLADDSLRRPSRQQRATTGHSRSQKGVPIVSV